MEAPEMSEDQATLEEHAEFLMLFRQALERGGYVAREIFETYPGERDDGLFAHLLRWQANAYLKSKGVDLVEFVQEKVNGSGLSFLVAGTHFRSWKAVDGEMPVARTRRVQAFCRQIRQLRLAFPDFDNMGPVVQNVSLLWDLDGKRNASIVEMLKPNTGKFRKGEQYWAWRIRVPDIFRRTLLAQPDVVEVDDDLSEIGFPQADVNPNAAMGQPESDEDD